MTEREKMARHITFNQEAWGGLASVDGSHYHPISLPLRGEFSKWMRQQQRVTWIADDVVWTCRRECNPLYCSSEGTGVAGEP